MGKVKPTQSETITTMVLTNTQEEQQIISNDNESVQYFYEIMKAEDQNQVLLEEEITVEDDSENSSEFNRLNILTEDLKQVIVKHNLSMHAANDIIRALNNYGINLPENTLQISDMQKTLYDIQADIRDIKKLLFCTQNEFVVNLPIISGLEELDEKLSKDQAFYNYFLKVVKIYKPTKGKCPNSYGLSKTFSDSILAEYNWDGTHGRKSFQNLKFLNRVLFDAWGGMPVFETYCNYTKSIRNQFTTARIRRHKRVIAAKAKQLELKNDKI